MHSVLSSLLGIGLATVISCNSLEGLYSVMRPVIMRLCTPSHVTFLSDDEVFRDA